jgi:hypothetical protein
LSFNDLEKKSKMAEILQMVLESIFLVFRLCYAVASNGFSSP